MRKIAVSDIHGCLKTFRKLLEDSIQLTREDQLFLLGDYVDRGPDSKGVLDYIMELTDNGFQLECLMGNHEQMMLNAFQDDEDIDVWLLNGGKSTLDSFGVEDVEDIPEKYFRLIRNFKYYLEIDEYILVHAGLNFLPPNNSEADSDFLWKVIHPFKDIKSMLWIRDWYSDIDYEWLRGRIIIHGHTPVSDDSIRSLLNNWDDVPVLDIDNGCFITYQDGMGQLCGFDLTHRKLYFHQNVEFN